MTIHVERSGEGGALVLSHGLASSSRTWHRQVAGLAETHTVITWDLPGHGRSARGDDEADYSREAALRHLGELIDSVDGPPVLVGHSLGGYLSLAHAIVRPGTVRGLVLVAAGPGYRDDTARERWNRSILRSADANGMPEVVMRIGLQHDALVMDGLASIDVPALILVGDEDERYHGAADYMERKMPRARQARVREGGHDVHETHADAVNREIEGFLAELPIAGVMTTAQARSAGASGNR